MTGIGPVDRDAGVVDDTRSLETAGEPPRTAAPTAGSASALVQAAYEQHRAAVFGFLVRGTRDPELAAEILQEAFIRLLKVTRAGDGPADARAWLFRVAGNLAISAARRRETVRRFAPWLVRPDEHRSPEDEVLLRETAGSVGRELAQLRPADRIALLMAGQGCSTAEIAHALGRKEVAARSVLSRARMRLRERMEQQEVAP